MAVVAAALNDLERRHGFDGISGEIDISFPAFSLADDPAGLWVAEEDGRIIGFAFSWRADRLWFLADLFVEPGRQVQGVGRMLLERVRQQARDSNASVEALITFAYNRTSLGLYMKHGMYPRMPLFQWSGPRRSLALDPSGPGLACEPMSQARDLDLVARIDRSVLGITREKHHMFSLSDPALSGFLFRTADSTEAGYVYVSRDGHIGPLAVTAAEFVRPAFATALGLAFEMGGDQVSAFLPGICDEALALALASRMRIGRTMVFVSSRPFGDWSRYCPRHPGYM
jgi:GNAT superfamily N-acetyltransferase